MYRINNRFDVIRIESKYEVFEVHELLSKVGIPLFESDEEIGKFLRNGSVINESHYIRRLSKGWRLEYSHCTGGYGCGLSDLRREVDLYLKHENRGGYSNEKRRQSDRQLHLIDKEFNEFMCYLSNNYYNIEHILTFKNRLSNLYEELSENYYVDFTYFKKSDKFDEIFNIHMRNKDRENIIDSIL